MIEPGLKKMSFVYKFLISLMAMSILLITAMVGISAKAQALTIRNNVVLTEGTIKLGDIFQGLRERDDSEKILGPAPLPGSEMVLNARTLMRIAIALDLPWRPSSSHEQIVLRRAATEIQKRDIENSLMKALSKEGVQGDFLLKISGAYPKIILPKDMPATLDIKSITYDPSQDWFEADIVAPSLENPINTSYISGRIDHLIHMPILKSNIRHGEIVGKNDIDFVKMSRKSLQRDSITKSSELIGMTPRRVALAGKPLLFSDMQAPLIVERGKFVTVIFEQGALKLTAKGKAMEHGAKGDTIRIINTTSNKTIEGLVVAENEVRVTDF